MGHKFYVNSIQFGCMNKTITEWQKRSINRRHVGKIHGYTIKEIEAHMSWIKLCAKIRGIK